MTRRRLVVVAALVVAAGGGIWAAVTTSEPQRPATAQQAAAVSTAQIRRGNLSATVSDDGTLGYVGRADGSPYAVVDHANGTYTALPALGQVIEQGHALYQVDGKPTVLLYGTTPAYRPLALGVSGADVAELNADLVALGDATPDQLSAASSSFGAATQAAVERLQAALGLTPTGMIGLGDAVFEPSALRVVSVPVDLGGAAQAGQVAIEATTTTRSVQVALSASQQTSVAVGDHVTITLPNEATTTGVVSTVSTVATCPSNSSGSSAQGTPRVGSDQCSGGSPPTIRVTITPDDPAATGTWDEAPVQVGITTATVSDALVVPVTALLAQPGGAYVVELAGSGTANRFVKVSLGVFDDVNGLVQVTGAGLEAGQNVVVAST